MSWRIVSVLVNQNKSYEIFSHISLKLTICMYMSVTTTTSESYYRQRRVVRGYIAEWRCCNPVNFYIFSKRVFFYHTTPIQWRYIFVFFLCYIVNIIWTLFTHICYEFSWSKINSLIIILLELCTRCVYNSTKSKYVCEIIFSILLNSFFPSLHIATKVHMLCSAYI